MLKNLFEIMGKNLKENLRLDFHSLIKKTLAKIGTR